MVNTAIADPITMDNVLKKAKNNRKAPGPNGIIIEQYKLLDNANLIIMWKTWNLVSLTKELPSDLTYRCFFSKILSSFMVS
jgi:hypothetical protein